jgi:hypothetical protein
MCENEYLSCACHIDRKDVIGKKNVKSVLGQEKDESSSIRRVDFLSLQSKRGKSDKDCGRLESPVVTSQRRIALLYVLDRGGRWPQTRQPYSRREVHMPLHLCWWCSEAAVFKFIKASPVAANMYHHRNNSSNRRRTENAT